MPKNLIQVSDVSHVQGNDIFLKDDDVQVVKADVFIYCTGYNYNFSFLDKSCGILLEGNHVKPLFKHIVNIKHPSMFFIGIPNQVTPLPLFHIQVCTFYILLHILQLNTQHIFDNSRHSLSWQF